MIDREKVIKGLEHCANEADCRGCVYREQMKGRSDGCDCMREALAMLKDQEPKIGHWIFESKYCEAWSHTCSECGKRMTTYVGKYASFCWNCGAKMTGGEV